MSKFWSKVVSQLEPYVPGEQPKIDNLIKLNTNENPYGPSPHAIEAMQKQAADSLRLYPDPNSDMLKDAIAEYYQLPEGCVFVGNGSDEVLAHVFQAFFKKEKPLLYPDITYSFYPVYCGLYGVDYKKIPLRQDFSIDLTDYREENCGIIFANPNAPTGHFIEVEKIETLLKNNTDSVVVVDEAYIDFGGDSAVRLIADFDNLLIVQTFSKSRCLAGLRIGFAMGQKPLIEGLERVKNSFNSYPLDRFAIFGGAAAMQDVEYFTATCNKIVASRKKLTELLQQRDFEVIPSLANFVFARNRKHDASSLSLALRQRKILVRHFSLPRIEQFLRISVGTDSECDALASALDDIFKG